MTFEIFENILSTVCDGGCYYCDEKWNHCDGKATQTTSPKKNGFQPSCPTTTTTTTVKCEYIWTQISWNRITTIRVDLSAAKVLTKNYIFFFSIPKCDPRSYTIYIHCNITWRYPSKSTTKLVCTCCKQLEIQKSPIESE